MPALLLAWQVGGSGLISPLAGSDGSQSPRSVPQRWLALQGRGFPSPWWHLVDPWLTVCPLASNGRLTGTSWTSLTCCLAISSLHPHPWRCWGDWLVARQPADLKWKGGALGHLKAVKTEYSGKSPKASSSFPAPLPRLLDGSNLRGWPEAARWRAESREWGQRGCAPWWATRVQSGGRGSFSETPRSQDCFLWVCLPRAQRSLLIREVCSPL